MRRHPALRNCTDLYRSLGGIPKKFRRYPFRLIKFSWLPINRAKYMPDRYKQSDWQIRSSIYWIFLNSRQANARGIIVVFCRYLGASPLFRHHSVSGYFQLADMKKRILHRGPALVHTGFRLPYEPAAQREGCAWPPRDSEMME